MSACIVLRGDLGRSRRRYHYLVLADKFPGDPAARTQAALNRYVDIGSFYFHSITTTYCGPKTIKRVDNQGASAHPPPVAPRSPRRAGASLAAIVATEATSAPQSRGADVLYRSTG